MLIERRLEGVMSTDADVAPLAGLIATREVRDNAARMMRKYAERALPWGVAWSGVAVVDRCGLGLVVALLLWQAGGQQRGARATATFLEVWSPPSGAGRPRPDVGRALGASRTAFPGRS